MGSIPDDEVRQLRERIRQLEAQLEQQPAADGRHPGRARRGHPVLSTTLIVLACLLAPFSVLSVWASAYASDTDQYVRTVAPLAEDPAVQAAVAAEVTDAVLEAVDVEGVTTDLLDALAAQENVPPRVAAAIPALAGPISNGVEGFAQDQVEKVLASEEFATLWAEVNRVAHEQLVTLLEGDTGGALSAQGDTVTLNLAPIIERVKEELLAQGFDLAANIPEVDRSFVLIQSEEVTKAQGLYRLLNALGLWLPFVTLGLFVVGVLVARNPRRAMLRGALGVVAAMLVLGVLLAIGRILYTESTPADILTSEAAGNVFDALVAPLRTGLRAVAVLGLVMVVIAFLSGPTAGAVKARERADHLIGGMRGGAEARGWRTGAVGPWTYRHRQGLRVAILLAAGLALVFWTRPTGWVVLGMTVVVALAVAIVQFLATPPLAPAEQAVPASSSAPPPTTPPPAAPPPPPRDPSSGLG